MSLDSVETPLSLGDFSTERGSATPRTRRPATLVPLHYCSTQRSCDLLRTRRDILNSYFEGSFPLSRTLRKHSSCVNALAFSNSGGRWMASAGDDMLVQLWDLQTEDVAIASTFTGPFANVFTLAFSATNKYLLSGGLDTDIFQYNIESPYSSRGRTPYTEKYTHHSGGVYAISCHPYQDEVFLSCSDDGSIFLHDSRDNHRTSKAQATLQLAQEITCVQYHPLMEHVFVTSETSGDVCLRDARMAFGRGSQRRNNGIVHQYATTLQEPGSLRYGKPSVSSVVFNTTGSRLAITSQNFYPTIYPVSDPYPIAICSGRYHPDGSTPPEGERTYSNTATTKHGSFGGPGLEGDEYYGAGSDDFRGYVWKIPSTHELESSRTISDMPSWSRDQDAKIAFCTTDSKDNVCVPTELSTPLFHLRGHDSIVNTVAIHPTYPLIASAGVESHVFLHSPVGSTPFSHESFHRTREDVRQLPEMSPSALLSLRRAMRDLDGPGGGDDVTIMFFDAILMSEEVNRTPFDIGRAVLDDESDSSSEAEMDTD